MKILDYSPPTQEQQPKRPNAELTSFSSALHIISVFIATYTKMKKDNNRPSSRLDLLETFLLCSDSYPWLFSVLSIITPETCIFLSTDIPLLMSLDRIPTTAVLSLSRVIGNNIAAVLDSEGEQSLARRNVQDGQEFLSILAKKLFILTPSSHHPPENENNTFVECRVAAIKMLYLSIMNDIYARSVSAARRLALCHLSLIFDGSRKALAENKLAFISAVNHALEQSGNIKDDTIFASSLHSIISHLFQW